MTSIVESTFIHAELSSFYSISAETKINTYRWNWSQRLTSVKPRTLSGLFPFPRQSRVGQQRRAFPRQRSRPRVKAAPWTVGKIGEILWDYVTQIKRALAFGGEGADSKKSTRGQVCEVCSEHAPRQFPMKSIPDRADRLALLCAVLSITRRYAIPRVSSGRPAGTGSSRSPSGTRRALLFFGPRRRRTRESCCSNTWWSYTRRSRAWNARASLIRTSPRRVSFRIYRWKATLRRKGGCIGIYRRKRRSSIWDEIVS